MLGVGFFVCGTPSNSRGFELVELGPEKLPGIPGGYLDKAPADVAECHRIESLLIDGRRYVQYSRVLRINPNDAEANRGAYIAVGCLIRERLPLHTVANCLDIVAELYGKACSRLTSDRAFPVGYRLGDFYNDGYPLEEKTAYTCSPLLIADVVLQALNGEGPIDWPNAREVLLAPQEMTAIDVSRYQLYSRQGPLGSLASLDRDRAHAQQTAQRATTVAQALVELQRDWASLEAIAERLLTKGEAFQRLNLEIERGVKRDFALDAGQGGSEGKQIPQQHKGPPTFRAGSQRVTVNHGTAHRRRSSVDQVSWLSSAGWPRALALLLVGAFVAVAAIVALRFLPESAVESPLQQAVVEPEQQEAERQPEQLENDVAKERAALDASPNE